MKYVDNQDGTFSVQAWEVTFTDGRTSCYVYSQSQLLDWMGDLASPPFEAEMIWLLRLNRPSIGTEIFA